MKSVGAPAQMGSLCTVCAGSLFLPICRTGVGGLLTSPGESGGWTSCTAAAQPGEGVPSRAPCTGTSLPSVHCLLTTGLEDSTGWKVNKTSWRFSPWHPDSLHTVGTLVQEAPLGTGLRTGTRSLGQPLLSAAPECSVRQVLAARWAGWEVSALRWQQLLCG